MNSLLDGFAFNIRYQIIKKIKLICYKIIITIQNNESNM